MLFRSMLFFFLYHIIVSQSRYYVEEFKEKGKRLKELTAKDNLSPEEVRERKQLYDKEKKEHENEQDKNGRS